MEILLFILIFYAGVFAGFGMKTWLYSRYSYSGTINVTKGVDKTLYLLELDDDPEELETKKEVVFKVVSSQ
jgi:hypothetical protein